MNRFHRVVFNGSVGVMQVVSELCESRAAGPGATLHKPTRLGRTTLAMTLVLTVPPSMGQTVTLDGGDRFELIENQTIGSLAGTADTTVDLRNHVLTTGGDNSSTTMAGQITGSGGLIKKGVGTFRLTGSSTYTGGTKIEAGTLAIGRADALGYGQVTLANGAELLSANASIDGVVPIVTSHGRLSAATGAHLAVLAVLGSRQGGGTLHIGSVGNAGTVSVSMGNGGGRAGPSQVNVDHGTLRYGDIDAGIELTNGNGRLHIADGAAADLNGVDVFTSFLEGAGRIENQASGTLSRLVVGAYLGSDRTAGPSSFSGAIADGLGKTRLIKQGENELTLSGPNTYSGGTVAQVGTLVLASSSALPTHGSSEADPALLAIGSAKVRAASADAIAAGFLSWTNRSELYATAARAVSGGSQTFVSTTQLHADVARAIEGGTQSFLGNSQLNANRTGSINGGSQLFAQSAVLQTRATDALTPQADVRFAYTHGSSARDLTGGVLALNGFSTTVGALRSQNGAGVIRNGGGQSATLTLDSSVLGGSTFSGRIVDSEDKAAAGSLALVKMGGDSFTVTGLNTYSGGTTVKEGMLVVGVDGRGSIAGNVDVHAGAILSGSGRIGGNVALAAGATLAPGNSIGTLRIDGDLSLASGGRLTFELGKASGSTPTPGESDRIVVGGNLNLSGATLDVIDAGGMGAGLYRLFDYGGMRTGSVAIGSTPAGASALSVQYLDSDKQVNLLDARDAELNFWNANGQAAASKMGGGSGVWSHASAVWTNATGSVTAPMQPRPGFGIFGGEAGTVTVDASAGDVNVTGMQFVSDGYVLAGDALHLSGAAPAIRVGALGVGDAALTATLNLPIVSSSGFVKQAAGTLMLGSSNSYAGQTTVAAGTLRGAAANTFSAASAVTVASGATLDTGGFNQSVGSLTNAGTVNLRGAAPGSTLTVNGSYVGNNGLLQLSTALDDSASVTDKLVINGSASGSTRVSVTNLGGLGGQTTGNGIEIVSTTGGIVGTPFTLAHGVSAGAYDYRLNTTASSAYLTSLSNTPHTPPTAAPAPALALPMYRVEASLYAALPGQLRESDLALVGNMHQRLGDADNGASISRAASGHRQAWGRIVSIELDMRQTGTVSPTSRGRLTGFQAGTDLLASRQWRTGVYVGQLEGDVRVSGFARGVHGYASGSNELRSQYLGAYATWNDTSGLYLDGVMQAGRHRYGVYASGASSSSGKGDSLLASVEAGQAFQIATRWVIEPQLQLVHQRVSLDDGYIVGARVLQDSDRGWTVRAGVRVKGEFQSGAGTVQPYAKLNIYKRSNGTDTARFLGPAAYTDVVTATGDTRSELAVGAQWQLSPRTRLYGEIGQLWASGGDVRTQGGVNASVGVKLDW